MEFSGKADGSLGCMPIEEVFTTNRLDEDYKATRCKLCPHCGSVVEKLSGCDTMVCGQDCHGGNTQKGCGARFAYSAAPAYAPDHGSRPSVARFEDAEPAELDGRRGGGGG
jgi:hypothetical protein